MSAQPVSACETARALSSSSLDEPLDDVPRGVLELHLAACPDCARFADEIGRAAELLRKAPLERFRLPLERIGRRRAFPFVSRVATAVIALFAVGLASLAGGAAPPSPGVTIERRAVLSPIKLPIGQRQAEPDFTATVRVPDEA